MALSPLALLNSKGQTSKRIDIVSASVTPTADCLLVVGTCRHDSAETLAISTTLAGVGPWTQVTVAASGMRTSIFYAKVTGSPGTGTITITGGSALAVPWRIEVAELTGHDTTTPVPPGQTATGQNAADPLVVNLPSAPAATSMVIGYLGTVDGGTGPVTPGAGFTELSDTTATSGSGRTQLQYDLAGADASCDWSNLSTTNNAGVVIEVAEAGGGGTVHAGEAAGASTTSGSATADLVRSAVAAGASTTAGAADALVPTRVAAAAGASTTSGTADAARLLAGAAAGASTTTGTAAALVPTRVVAAAGSSSTAGTADATIPGATVHDAAAGGSSSTAGTATGALVRSAGATGAAATAGAATAARLLAATAAGASTTSGTAAALALLAGAATGTASSSGVATAVILLTATAAGASTTAGAATATAGVAAVAIAYLIAAELTDGHVTGELTAATVTAELTDGRVPA